jgi:PII-like signaling protein
MKKPENGVLLRIFIGESDKEPGRERPLYEAIVRRAREAHLAGATVLRGPMGFGRHSRVHTAKLLELSTDLPILIEIVDSEEKVDAFLPTVDELVDLYRSIAGEHPDWDEFRQAMVSEQRLVAKLHVEHVYGTP